MKSGRGPLVAKLILAGGGTLSVLYLGGPWWYVGVCLFAMMIIAVDAIAAYRRDKHPPQGR